MVKKSVISLLVMMVVFVGCGEDKPDKVKPKAIDGVADERPMKRIIWKKDGAVMELIPAGSFEMGDHFNEGDDDELPVQSWLVRSSRFFVLWPRVLLVFATVLWSLKICLKTNQNNCRTTI